MEIAKKSPGARGKFAAVWSPNRVLHGEKALEAAYECSRSPRKADSSTGRQAAAAKHPCGPWPAKALGQAP